MKFIAIDLELNQPSNKIIQIGAAAFDTDSKTPYKPLQRFLCYVYPREEVNWQQPLKSNQTLEQLLGPVFKEQWNKNKLDSKQAFTIFWQWLTDINHGKKIIQWGRGDFYELIKQSKETGVNYPQRLIDFDIKKQYQLLYQPALGLKKSPGGLQAVCRAMEIEFEGRAHDALVDAINTGKLAIKMYQIIRKFYHIEREINA